MPVKGFLKCFIQLCHRVNILHKRKVYLSPSGKDRNKVYYSSPSGKDKGKVYYLSPSGKDRNKVYC